MPIRYCGKPCLKGPCQCLYKLILYEGVGLAFSPALGSGITWIQGEVHVGLD